MFLNLKATTLNIKIELSCGGLKEARVLSYSCSWCGVLLFVLQTTLLPSCNLLFKSALSTSCTESSY